MSQTSWISRQAFSLERQRAASGNASDLLDIETSLQSWETASSQWQCLRPIGYRGRPSVLRDSEQPVAMPQTYWISRQAFSLERQRAASGNASDLLDIEAGLQSWETASSQWQCLRPIGYRGRPSVLRDSEQPVAMPQTYWISRQAFSLERQRAASGNASDLLDIEAGLQSWEPASSQCNVSDLLDIEAGLQSWETASSQWQCLRPIGYRGRPSVLRDSEQSVQCLRPLGYRGRPSVLGDSKQSVQCLRPLGYRGRPSVLRDSEQSVAMSQIYWISRQAFSLERQRAVSGNALDLLDIEAGLQSWETASSQCNVSDLLDIEAGLQSWETASSQWQCLRPIGYRGRPSVLRDSEQSVAMPQTYWISRQAFSLERQRAVSSNVSDLLDIETSLQSWETASSQWQCLRPIEYRGRPTVLRDSEQSAAMSQTSWISRQAYSLERQRAVSSNVSDLLDIETSLQSWETASSQQQCLRPIGYRGRPSVLRDSEQSAAMSQTSWISRQAYSLERQRAASGNASDLLNIEAGLQSWETASSQQQCLRPLGYRDKPTALRDSEQSAAMSQTSWISRQAYSLERQRAVSSNASDLLDIEAGLQSWETASSQQQCLRPLGYRDKPTVLRDSEQPVVMPQTYWISRQAFSLERQRAVSSNASDLLDIEASLQSWETASSQ